jgi:hypothetical protein
MKRKVGWKSGDSETDNTNCLHADPIGVIARTDCFGISLRNNKAVEHCIERLIEGK